MICSCESHTWVRRAARFHAPNLFRFFESFFGYAMVITEGFRKRIMTAITRLRFFC